MKCKVLVYPDMDVNPANGMPAMCVYCTTCKHRILTVTVPVRWSTMRRTVRAHKRIARDAKA